MKKLILLSLVLCIAIPAQSQCEISTFIEDNYTIDASILALREILSDPADPDYDNAFVPAERITPYLEKLSAIHENPSNDPRIDSLFNEFQFHVNPGFNIYTEYKELAFVVPTNVTWVQPLKDTGVSGYQDLDDFIALYQLSVINFIDLTSSGNTIFRMETSFEFLNIEALVDDLVAFEDIIIAEPSGNSIQLNYTGVPYIVYGDFGNSGQAQVCDIFVEGDIYEFYLGADDCFAGCQAIEYRYISVSEDCQTVDFLSTPDFSVTEITLFPNPATKFITVTNNQVPISNYTTYSLDGKTHTSQTFTNTIDVSSLPSGIYFIIFTSEEGTQQTKKFIKK